MLPAGEKIVLVLEAIGDDKIRVNSSSLNHPLTILLSTPEQKCIGWPEQKYISEAGKKAPRTGGPWFRHQAWIGLSAGVSELAGRGRRLL